MDKKSARYSEVKKEGGRRPISPNASLAHGLLLVRKNSPLSRAAFPWPLRYIHLETSGRALGRGREGRVGHPRGFNPCGGVGRSKSPAFSFGEFYTASFNKIRRGGGDGGGEGGQKGATVCRFFFFFFLAIHKRSCAPVVWECEGRHFHGRSVWRWMKDVAFRGKSSVLLG